MEPFDVGLSVTVAVIWGLAFTASRIARAEFSPTLRFAVAALPWLAAMLTVVGGIAVMLLSKRRPMLPTAA